ncbi:beta-ketoacyl synthase N-terminal-like domain-containing protein [Chitinophaga sp.]|uniref:type I polyketide synthase n=1 Tax=Chitinophaga sp. TaxID=1869181 RepID=UPI0031E18C05
MQQISDNDIAIIGIAGRFPKSDNIAQYWQNLADGVNSIERADDEKIQASGVAAGMLQHKRFVHATTKLNDARCFDADFFGMSHTEALHMDPQIRLLLQSSWHALEDAGYDTTRHAISVGNFCGMSSNHYLLNMLQTNALNDAVDPLLYRILNDKDFLATWISYKLNLTGPAFSVQTACSTSLLAVHLACQSLLNRECDMALAGGVAYSSDDKVGYIHTPASIYSKDGICRPFDIQASGIVDGCGVGTVVLKRAADAIRDKDHIYALIKGTAVNNDGANKQGYTTPSVDLQRDVVLEALAVANIDAASIGMIEAHGTGTFIGDPIEVAALTEAFRAYTETVGYCALGSVKSNIGHLDAAAGIASLIKAVLCVEKGMLVPSINFTAPNPGLQLGTSPFYVSRKVAPWPAQFDIRRAGISSLGVGGTNVHVVIEQAPAAERAEVTAHPHVVTLSAAGAANLQSAKAELAAYIRQHEELRLEDIAYTTVYGRRQLPYRFAAVCSDKETLLAQLNGADAFEGESSTSSAVFLFPGQGSQFINMATGLYNAIAAFKKDVDDCLVFLQQTFQVDFKPILFGDNSQLLERTENTQVVLFIVEYSLARELQRTGVQPVALVGHSLGEYVAACIAGCLSLHDALTLVYHRARLMGAMPGGAMVLVRGSLEDIRPLLLHDVHVCAVNAADNIVIGGREGVIEGQLQALDAHKKEYIRLKVSHAYHTPMMQGVLTEYAKVLSTVTFHPFEQKIFSTYTGRLAGPEQFCNPQYWLDQIMHPVLFKEAVHEVTAYVSNPVFIEVGPGNGLSSFVKSISGQAVSTVNLLPRNNPVNKFYAAKAQLLVKGIPFSMPLQHDGRKISLPGYVFTKKYFWKPPLQVHYKDFIEAGQSYHAGNNKYTCERLKTSVELKPAQKLPEQVLTQLHALHTKYIQDLEALMATSEVSARIEFFYNDEVNTTTTTKATIGQSVVAPVTPVEQAIALHWKEVLGYSAVSVLDNYFEVGGNSLLATRLMTRLSDEFELELTFKELSECLTIRDLAALVESRQRIMNLVEEGNNDNYLEL